MEPDMKLNFALTELLCGECRLKPSESNNIADVVHSLAHIELPDSEGAGPIAVTLDIERLEFHKQEKGRYVAHAVVKLRCPDCGGTRELRRQLQAIKILVTNTGTCGNCGGELEFENETIIYTDEKKTGPQMELRGNLVCHRCNRARSVVIQKNIDSLSLEESCDLRVNVPAGDIIMERDQIFISYSHADEKWLEKLRTHLSPLVRDERIKLWADTEIPTGAKWQDEIGKAISRAKVAVLLVSPNFLASEFITDKELPFLLDAAENQGLTIIWIPVSASVVSETDIAKYQAGHDPSQPLDGLSDANQNRILVKICNKIQAAANS